MITFQVNDMTCGHCGSVITKAIAEVDKAARVEVDIPRKLVRVCGEATVAEVAEAIRDAGYSPLPTHGKDASTASVSRNHSGCGCGCGPHRTASVDPGQAATRTAGSCCA